MNLSQFETALGSHFRGLAENINCAVQRIRGETRFNKSPDFNDLQSQIKKETARLLEAVDSGARAHVAQALHEPTGYAIHQRANFPPDREGRYLRELYLNELLEAAKSGKLKSKIDDFKLYKEQASNYNFILRALSIQIIDEILNTNPDEEVKQALIESLRLLADPTSFAGTSTSIFDFSDEPYFYPLNNQDLRVLRIRGSYGRDIAIDPDLLHESCRLNNLGQFIYKLYKLKKDHGIDQTLITSLIDRVRSLDLAELYMEFENIDNANFDHKQTGAELAAWLKDNAPEKLRSALERFASDSKTAINGLVALSEKHDKATELISSGSFAEAVAS